MDETAVRESFTKMVNAEPDQSVGVIAIRILMEVIKKSRDNTVQELHHHLKESIVAMKTSNHPVAAINSSCELFMRFITLTPLDFPTFEECKTVLLGRGQEFLNKIGKSREIITNLATKFITKGAKVLTHSRSRVVLQALTRAAQVKQLEVFVATSAPDNSGAQMYQELKAAGVTCTLILDSAVGYIMERMDMVMVGAECVAESGGIINKLGTYTLAIAAHAMRKPFYVLAESFKFTRLYPLSQTDVPTEYKYGSDNTGKDMDNQDKHPLVDYTPPKYITLLFTNLGILTTAAVCDELINLYL